VQLEGFGKLKQQINALIGTGASDIPAGGKSSCWETLM
jgi:hypothetical protein